MKRTFCLLAMFLTFTTSAYADFKYTEEHISKMDMPIFAGMPDMNNMQSPPNMQGAPNMPGMPPGMMANMMQQMQNPPPQIVDVYIKGARKRIDNKNDNKTTLTMCDKRQIVKINHNEKNYVVIPLDQKVKEMEQICGSIQNMEFVTETINQPQSGQNNNGQLIMKTTINDTGQVEQVGSIQAKKYVRVYETYGNPQCMPDTKIEEIVWAANIQFEDLNCPSINKFKGCPELPSMKARPDRGNMDCFSKAKIIVQGLRDIPGFIVKREMDIDMGAMMQGAKIPRSGLPDADLSGSFKVKEITMIKNTSNNTLPESMFEIPEGYTLTLRDNDNRHYIRP